MSLESELIGPGGCPVLVGDIIVSNPALGLAGTVIGSESGRCTVRLHTGDEADLSACDILAHLDPATGQSKKLRVVDMIGEIPVDVDGWSNALLRCSSYERIPVLVYAAPYMAAADWLALLSDNWENCDNIGEHVVDLMSFTPLGDLTTDLAPLRSHLMNEDERAALAALPDEVTVYRGCYALNKWGLSWTTDRAVAERFPTLHRYRQDGQPLLVTARARKANILAVKGGRDEAEIICYRPKHVSTRHIARRP